MTHFGSMSAAIGGFIGIVGGSLKNAMCELGHSILKGLTVGLIGGAMMAAAEQDAVYLWEGVLIGVALTMGMAGLRIVVLGATFIPDTKYGALEGFAQVYRRGSVFMRNGSGITLGRHVAVKRTGNLHYDRYLLQHETGHLAQISDVGVVEFYGRIVKEYVIKPGFRASYHTPGTLEYGANYYAFQRLGYYYSGKGIRNAFP
ncbi:hypothetical protein [Porphyromonas loveana]|uniref:hypothetical protein n=1 Tax=Porphyromonas loveana TaxID=1884669 RepID=UPI0035A193D9